MKILETVPLNVLQQVATQILGKDHAASRTLATAVRTGSKGAEIEARNEIRKLPHPTQENIARRALLQTS